MGARSSPVKLRCKRVQASSLDRGDVDAFALPTIAAFSLCHALGVPTARCIFRSRLATGEGSGCRTSD